MSRPSRVRLAAFLEPRGFASSLTKTGNRSSNLPQHLAVGVSDVNALSGSDLSHAIRFAAAKNPKDARLWHDLGRRALFLLPSLKPPSLAFVVNGFSKTSFRDEELFRGVSEQAQDKILEFGAQDAALLLNAFAKCGFRCLDLFDCFAEHCDRFLPSATEQHLALVANAFARTEIRRPELFEKLSFYAIRRMDSFSPQGVANCFHAWAKLGFQDRALFAALLKRIQDFVICDLDNQHIANILDSCAKLDVWSESVLQNILIKQGIVGGATAGAGAPCPTGDIFADGSSFSVGSSRPRRRRSFQPREVSSILSAVCRFPNREANEEAISLLVQRCSQDLGRYRCHELATILNALSLMSTYESGQRGGREGTSRSSPSEDNMRNKFLAQNRVQFEAKNRLFEDAARQLADYLNSVHRRNLTTVDLQQSFSISLGLILAAYARQHAFAGRGLRLNSYFLEAVVRHLVHFVDAKTSDQSVVNWLYACGRLADAGGVVVVPERRGSEINDAGQLAARGVSSSGPDVLAVARRSRGLEDHEVVSEGSSGSTVQRSELEDLVASATDTCSTQQEPSSLPDFFRPLITKLIGELDARCVCPQREAPLSAQHLANAFYALGKLDPHVVPAARVLGKKMLPFLLEASLSAQQVANLLHAKAHFFSAQGPKLFSGAAADLLRRFLLVDQNHVAAIEARLKPFSPAMLISVVQSAALLNLSGVFSETFITLLSRQVRESSNRFDSLPQLFFS